MNTQGAQIKRLKALSACKRVADIQRCKVFMVSVSQCPQLAVVTSNGTLKNKKPKSSWLQFLNVRNWLE
jgi:hypothetical protein